VCLDVRPGDRLAVIVAGGSFPRWEPVRTPSVHSVLAGSSLTFHRLPGA
jgi:hypothetical protein